MKTQPNPADLRVKKTKRAIRNAFAKLLNKKDVNDITVTELSREAGINRKTFYNYYSGVYQIADEMLLEIGASYDRILSEVDFTGHHNNQILLLEKLTALVDNDPEFFGYIFAVDGNRRLTTVIIAMLQKKTKEVMLRQLPVSDEAAGIVLDFVFGGMLSVYQKWLASDRRQPLNEVSEIMNRMIFSGMDGALNITRRKTGAQSES